MEREKSFLLLPCLPKTLFPDLFLCIFNPFTTPYYTITVCVCHHVDVGNWLNFPLSMAIWVVELLIKNYIEFLLKMEIFKGKHYTLWNTVHCKYIQRKDSGSAVKPLWFWKNTVVYHGPCFTVFFTSKSCNFSIILHLI